MPRSPGPSTAYDDGPDDRPAAFPARRLGFSFVLAVLVIGWLGWQITAAPIRWDGMRARQIRAEELRGEIMRLDETLTMSARLAAATGDPAWERRYLADEPVLGRVIGEATRLLPMAARTDSANAQLVAMERAAFALGRAGRAREAAALLASPGYAQQKRVYAAGMAAFSRALRAQQDSRWPRNGPGRSGPRPRPSSASWRPWPGGSWAPARCGAGAGRWKRQAAARTAANAPSRPRSRPATPPTAGSAPSSSAAPSASCSSTTRGTSPTPTRVRRVRRARRGRVAGPAGRRAVARRRRRRDHRPGARAARRPAGPGHRRAAVPPRRRRRALGAAHPVAPRRRRGATFVGVVQDVTERKRLESELTRQALHDPLTGLANRALFQDRVARALGRAARQPAAAAVLYLDLDDFKRVNDTLGHAAGDALLAAVADRLLNATRGCDTVARLGGDEFAVLLDHVADPGDALTVVDRVLAALARPVAVGAAHLVPRASVGVAHAAPGMSADDLVRDADVAMYHAKRRGAGGYELFVPAMREAVVVERAFEADLGAALDAGEFRLVYQPILALDGAAPAAPAAVTGAEALLRWEHPTRGLVSPAEFIQRAERTGLIVAIGRWVLRTACRDAATWPHGAGGPPTVAVNVSARQLADPRLVDDVTDALAAARLPAERLLLEITETTLAETRRPRSRGCRRSRRSASASRSTTSGTGYSSLAYLQRFPVDVLKIDKAFVDGVARDESDAAIVRAIVALGQALGCGRWPRASRRPRSATSCARSGARTGRGTSSRARCRPTSSPRCSARPSPRAPGRGSAGPRGARACPSTAVVGPGRAAGGSEAPARPAHYGAARATVRPGMPAVGGAGDAAAPGGACRPFACRRPEVRVVPSPTGLRIGGPILVRAPIARFSAVAAGLILCLASAACGAPGARPGDGRPRPTWYAGGAACAGRPAFLVREYRPGLFVLRQPACTNFEKPFLFLLVGALPRAAARHGGGGHRRGGAHRQPPRRLACCARRRPERAGRRAHARSRGSRRRRRPVPRPCRRDAGRGRHGGRPRVLRLPGVADRRGVAGPRRARPRRAGHSGTRTREPRGLRPRDGVLLTGDTFYPGRLYVRDTAAFAASTARLVAFTASRPVSAILGTHVEQARTPFTDYPVGTQDQPDEDRLELSRAELVTLDSAVRSMRGRFARVRLPRFTIWPL
jgi:diguanylate cyclase (GGDEF)-like protein